MLATPLVGGTVLKVPLPGTTLPGGGALPGTATVFTQNQMGRTKASQQRTIVVTVAGDPHHTVDDKTAFVTDFYCRRVLPWQCILWP